MNHPLVAAVEAKYKKKNIPDIHPGDVVRVHQIIKEGNKERVQVFEGIVIKRQHGSEMGATFTVRKIAAAGIGVEKTYLIHSPIIVKIERVKTSKVRRSKLFHLRDTKSSKMRLNKETAATGLWEEPEAEKELEKIKEEQAAEAEEKAEEKAQEEQELEKKFEQAQSKHSDEKGDDTNGSAGGEAGEPVSKEEKIQDPQK
jgi:large subunit ribosomal protein L19